MLGKTWGEPNETNAGYETVGVRAKLTLPNASKFLISAWYRFEVKFGKARGIIFTAHSSGDFIPRRKTFSRNTVPQAPVPIL